MASFMQFLENHEVRMRLGIDLPEDIRILHKAFKKSGKHLYLVGGAVRDAALDKRPKDFDLATNATPPEVIEILKSNGINHTKGAVGNQFGVVIASIGNEDYEIATFRKDSGSRQVADTFSNIRDDAERRDLTINALYYDLDTQEVVDLVGGLQDLKMRRVKTVGDPDQRFGEDALRVLRYVRFYCRVNNGSIGGIDEETRAAIAKRVNNGLASDNGVAVAPERIRDEFLKGLKSAKSVMGYVGLYHQLGLLQKYVFPGLVVSHDYVETKNHVLLIAHLLRLNDIEKIKNKLNQLKYTNDEVDNVVYLVNLLHLPKIHEKLKERPNFLYGLRKGQREIAPEDLEAWSQLHGLDVRAIKQLRAHQLQNRDEVPGAAELQGKEIGQHIMQHNTKEMLRKMGFREWLNQ